MNSSYQRFCRVQFGQPIANFQGMQFQYAEAAIQIEAARTMMYNAARMKQAGAPAETLLQPYLRTSTPTGLPVVKEAAMCKFLATTVAEATASKCVNWMGGNGISEQVYQRSDASMIAAAAVPQMQLNVL
jgi:alkylation response protein AidB-like acyl-CoA dehydrogenase